MFDPLLKRCFDYTPKISKELNGTVKKEFEEIPAFLENVFSNSMKMLSPGIPLEFLGIEKVSPKEEIKYNTTTRYVHDIAESYLYMIKFVFRYNKKDIIEKPMYIPFAERGNLTKLSGTRYVVSQVVSDRSISPSNNGIFLKLMISKLNFSTVMKTIIKNQQKYAVSLLHSKLLLLNIDDKLGKPITPIFIYLLTKYGLSSYSRNLIFKYDVTENDYEDYDVYESTTIKPRGHLATVYKPHNLKILVNKNHNDEPLIANLLYCLDMFPELSKDLINVYGNDKKEKEFFTMVLARLLYKDSYSLYRMLDDTKQHLMSLEGYLDAITAKNLRYVGIDVENFYKLLETILFKYSDLVVNFKDYHNNLNNKYLDVLSYITYNIYYTFNKVLLRINSRGPTITLKEVSKNLSELSSKKIFSIIKSSGVNLTLSVFDYSGDLIYPKSTAIIEDQSRGNGVERGRNNQFPASLKSLTAQQAVRGTLLYLGKSAPTPALRRNIFLDTHDGNIMVPNHLLPTIEAFGELLKLNKDDNSGLDDIEAELDEE